MPLRTPEQIVDALASQRGLVTPVPAYYPLGVSFTAGCLREAYRDVIDLLSDTSVHFRGSPEATFALRAVSEQLTEVLKVEE